MATKTKKAAASKAVKSEPDSKLSVYHKTFAGDPDDKELRCPDCSALAVPVLVFEACPECGSKDAPTFVEVNKSMFEMVDEHLQVDSRGKVVRDLSKIFSVTERTVDRCIAEVHAMWNEGISETYAKRKQQYVRRKNTLYKKALRKGDIKTADHVLMGLVEIQGDKKPEMHLLLSGDKDPAALLKQADEMRKLAEEAEE